MTWPEARPRRRRSCWRRSPAPALSRRGPPTRSRPATRRVKVDTPQLRALKAATHIAPCPTSVAGTEGVPGGLPDMTLPCLGGGRSVDLAGLRGPLLVNFWAQMVRTLP